MKLLKIKILDPKKDKNGKSYRPCVAEFEGKDGGYWHNIYLSSDVVNSWVEGDEVEVSLKEAGRFKNFDPIIEKGQKPTQPTPSNPNPAYPNEAWFRQIDAKLDGLRAYMEQKFEELKSGEKLPF